MQVFDEVGPRSEVADVGASSLGHVVVLKEIWLAESEGDVGLVDRGYLCQKVQYIRKSM